MKISIILPCYNEELNIKHLIFQAEKLKKHFNFILVNNGSNDGTDTVLKSLKIPLNCKYIKINKNKGYGYGIKTGLKITNSDYVGWMHGDLQQNLSILKKIIPLITNHNNNEKFFIKGLRTKRNFFDLFFTFSMAILMSIVFNKKHWDVAGQPTIIKKKYLKKLLVAPNDFSFDFYVYNFFVMKNFKILRFNAPFLKRKFGVSSWDKGLISKLKHSYRTFKYIIHLKNSKTTP
tara:strand:+ start:584 stop:1282 length:699 start_codon:yes stop_codon:yes gene_type:complete